MRVTSKKKAAIASLDAFAMVSVTTERASGDLEVAGEPENAANRFLPNRKEK